MGGSVIIKRAVLISGWAKYFTYLIIKWTIQIIGRTTYWSKITGIIKNIYQAGGMTQQNTVVTEQKDDQYHRFTTLLAVRTYFGQLLSGDSVTEENV
jgi:hypothetical protein